MQIALTFDDGPSEWTPEILDLLGAADARATFFLVGISAQRRPDLVRRLVTEGHEVGNHTWSHPALESSCDEEQIRDELIRAGDAIERAGAPRPTLFRAPHYDAGPKVHAVGRELSLRHVNSDVAPPDWHPRWTSQLTATFVAQQVRPGAIVGLHDGLPPDPGEARSTCAGTVEAVRLLLPMLKARGAQFVSASDALAAV